MVSYSPFIVACHATPRGMIAWPMAAWAQSLVARRGKARHAAWCGMDHGKARYGKWQGYSIVCAVAPHGRRGTTRQGKDDTAPARQGKARFRLVLNIQKTLF